MKAMIMAAGVGSRLMPLTVTMPKPMVPLLGKPVMEYGVQLLKKHGITEIIANLHYLPDVIKGHFKDGRDFGIKLEYSYEENLLGTAGGVKNNQWFLNEDTFVILSGDGLTNIDLTEMYQFHKQKKALATIALKSEEDVSKFGVVVLNEDCQITQFQEKPSKEDALSNLVNTGIYIFEPEIFKYIPEAQIFDFGMQLFPFLVKRKIPFFGWQTGCYWSDIGSFETYKQTQFDILSGEVNVNINSKKVINRQIYIGERTKVEKSTKLTGSVVIGNNSFIGKGCVIHNSVILDNVEIDDGVLITNSVIGKDCKIKSNVVINSDCVLADENIIAENAELLKGVKVWPGNYIMRQDCIGKDLVG